MAPDMNQSRDLVLPPNTYAHVLESTKGRVTVLVGPNSRSLSAQESLVVWDTDTNEFNERHMAAARQTCVKADEGQYILLINPARDTPDLHPEPTSATDTYSLDIGRKIIIHGPANFALWPGQGAQVIDGHHLRHNQYLLVRVYEPEQARANAGAAVMAPQQTQQGAEEEKTSKKSKTTAERVETYAMGQLMVIRGTDVSFYIPPTGIEVIPDQHTGAFIREAVTLERLEHAILLDEDGEKRYVKGPAVVFPQPTEQFIRDADGEPKAKAIELNALSGLYIKAVTDYQNTEPQPVLVERGGIETKVEPGATIREGDELFITGETTPIYFPQPEHMLLTYRGQRKHHAIAIPSGEGRYVLERKNGNVRLVCGPTMFLPDPRREVVVQRVLDPDMVKIMYPGNNEALQFNQAAVGQQVAAESVAHQNLASDQSVMAMASTTPPPGQIAGAMYTQATVMPESSATPEELLRSTSSKQARRGGKRPGGATGYEQMSRGTSFSKPRTIVLDTKYQGAVGVNLWPGYAVLVTDKTGNRRVEIGPVNLLLNYDEQLMRISLSTGTPKRNSDLIHTVYLRTLNNRISDQITVETRDLVPVRLGLAFRVNFEGDPEQWFNVENYIQLLTDNCRSRLRNVAKQFEIQEFYTRTIDIVRDTLLGARIEDNDRLGLAFHENGMRLFEVEVTQVSIEHADTANLLGMATRETLTAAIQLESRERNATMETRLHEISRLMIGVQQQTAQVESVATLANLTRESSAVMARITADKESWEAQNEIDERALVAQKALHEQEIGLTRSRNEVTLDLLGEETAQRIRMLAAVDPKFVDAIRMLGDELLATKVVEALGPVALATNSSAADVFSRTFANTPLGDIMGTLAARPHAQFAGVGAGNGDH